MDHSPPGSSILGILQAIILEWVAIPFSRGSPDPGTEPRSPALQSDSLPSFIPLDNVNRKVSKIFIYFYPIISLLEIVPQKVIQVIVKGLSYF